MERSLRAVGCTLPLWVIPLDEKNFDLPANSQWWLNEEIAEWTRKETTPTKRKYQVLTESNYQYVDTDVLFLKNPELVLAPLQGFVASCDHWTRVEQSRVVTPESKKIMQKKTTFWQKNVFCSGQFACDRVLYDADELIETAVKPEHLATCVKPPYGDQEGLNLLVFLSSVPVTNLTLPPHAMESTWPGHYEDDPWSYWDRPEREPYLLHCYLYTWRLHENRKVNWLFRELLTRAEQAQWIEQAEVWKYEYESKSKRRYELLEQSRIQRLIARLERTASVFVRGYY